MGSYEETVLSVLHVMCYVPKQLTLLLERGKEFGKYHVVHQTVHVLVPQHFAVFMYHNLGTERVEKQCFDICR